MYFRTLFSLELTHHSYGITSPVLPWVVIKKQSAAERSSALREWVSALMMSYGTAKTQAEEDFARTGIPALPVRYGRNAIIVAQGNRATAMYYIRTGKVKLTICSPAGKQAVVAILGPGDYFGECSLIARPWQNATAVALTNCSILTIEQGAALRLLASDSRFAERFRAYLVERIVRTEEDLADQIMNPAEKRLARLLVTLAEPTTRGGDWILPRISHESMAEMIGTTRSRVTILMNKFRRFGYISRDRGLVIIHQSVMEILDSPSCSSRPC